MISTARARHSGLPRILVLLMLCVVVGSAGCTAQFPTQPSTPGTPVALYVRYPVNGLRFMVGDNVSSSQMRAFTVDAERVYVDVTQNTTWSTSNNQVMRPVIDVFGQPSRDWFLPGAGNAELYATYKGLTATLPITVRAVPPRPYLQIRRSLFGFSVTQVNAIGSGDVTSSVTFSVSDPSVLTIAGGGTQIVQKNPGNVEIRASLNGMTDSFWMSVPFAGQ